MLSSSLKQTHRETNRQTDRQLTPINAISVKDYLLQAFITKIDSWVESSACLPQPEELVIIGLGLWGAVVAGCTVAPWEAIVAPGGPGT